MQLCAQKKWRKGQKKLVATKGKGEMILAPTTWGHSKTMDGRWKICWNLSMKRGLNLHVLERLPQWEAIVNGNRDAHREKTSNDNDCVTHWRCSHTGDEFATATWPHWSWTNVLNESYHAGGKSALECSAQSTVLGDGSRTGLFDSEAWTMESVNDIRRCWAHERVRWGSQVTQKRLFCTTWTGIVSVNEPQWR